MLDTSKILDRRYISRGAWIYLSGLVVRLGAKVPLLLIAGRLYGAALYGEYMIGTGLVETAAAVATLGFKRTLFGFMHHGGPEEGPESNRTAAVAVRHALFIGISFGCFFAAALMVAAPFFARLFGVPEAAGKIAVFAWITPVIVATDIFLTATFFNRRLRYDIWARCVAEPGVQTVVAGAFYLGHLTGVGLLASYAAALAAACGTGAWGYAQQFGVKATAGRIEWRRLVDMTRGSFSTGVFDILGMLVARLDMFVIGHFFSAQAVGLYGMALQFLTLPDRIAKSFTPVVMPVISQALHERDFKRARAALAAMAPRQAALEGILVVAFIAFGAFLLDTFGGKEFVAAAAVLAILSAGQLVNDILAIAGLPLVVMRPAVNPNAAVLSLVVYAIAVGVVQRSFGIEGVAVISVLAALVGNLWRVYACSQVLFSPTLVPAVETIAETLAE